MFDTIGTKSIARNSTYLTYIDQLENRYLSTKAGTPKDNGE